MKTEKELERKIMKLTMKIQKEYPELSKFMEEMPMINPEKDIFEINIDDMDEYYNSLKALLVEYSKTHAATK